MTASLIRAMANTLHDGDVDPLNSAAVCVALVRAGWAVKQIAPVYDEVILMALVRRTNEKRKRHAEVHR